MTDNELRDFIYENYHRRTSFPEENSYQSMEHKKTGFTIISN